MSNTTTQPDDEPDMCQLNIRIPASWRDKLNEIAELRGGTTASQIVRDLIRPLVNPAAKEVTP